MRLGWPRCPPAASRCHGPSRSKAADCWSLSEKFGRAAQGVGQGGEPAEARATRVFNMLSALTGAIVQHLDLHQFLFSLLHVLTSAQCQQQRPTPLKPRSKLCSTFFANILPAIAPASLNSFCPQKTFLRLGQAKILRRVSHPHMWGERSRRWVPLAKIRF
jgi:hypothetical protein